MYKHILLPVDLNDEHPTFVATGVEYAQQFGATLHVLTVIPDFGAHSISHYFSSHTDEKITKGARDELSSFISKHIPREIGAKPIVARGTVYEVIIGTARDTYSDLIILGAHRPGLKDYLLGSNAERVVRHADCSVLVVRTTLNPLG